MKVTGRLMLAAVAVLAAVFAAATLWYQRAEDSRVEQAVAPNAGQLIRPDAITLGPADATVTVVEFLDPECEACAAMHPIVKQVLRDFDGRLRLVIRYLPLHRNSVYAAGLLEGARAQGKFWEALDVFLAKQPEWASHEAPRPGFLVGYIRSLGLNEAAVISVATSEQTRRRIELDQSDASSLGVNRTPTFFVNGQRLARLGYEPLRDAVAAALDRK